MTIRPASAGSEPPLVDFQHLDGVLLVRAHTQLELRQLVVTNIRCAPGTLQDWCHAWRSPLRARAFAGALPRRPHACHCMLPAPPCIHPSAHGRYGPGDGAEFLRGEGPTSRLVLSDTIWLGKVCLPPGSGSGSGGAAEWLQPLPGVPRSANASQGTALQPAGAAAGGGQDAATTAGVLADASTPALGLQPQQGQSGLMQRQQRPLCVRSECYDSWERVGVASMLVVPRSLAQGARANASAANGQYT